MRTLGEMGEHEVIDRLTSMLGRDPQLIVGIGDDCAVTRLPDGGTDQVFTTDPVIEGIHFLPGEQPSRIGNKAAGRVLSDIAAMGARPQWMLVNLVAPEQMDFGYLEAVYGGMAAQCSRFGAPIIGGDLARGPHLEIHVFGTGLLPAGKALLRSGAKSGDSIFVTGPLGCSRRGKHLDFVPRIEEGIVLRESGRVGAMMDISDGLATDLRHIMEQSGVGAELCGERIPRVGTLEEALYDGEDFELLFTLPPDDAGSLLDEWKNHFTGTPFCIGSVTEEVGVLRLNDNGSSRQITGKAFEHFRSDAGTL